MIQEKIQKKAERFGKLAPAFLEGAKFALENQWISVEEDLPCKHADLLESENLTKDVLVVLAWKNDPTKKHIGVCYMCNIIGLYTVDFYWKSNPYYVVTHWKRLPELPDE